MFRLAPPGVPEPAHRFVVDAGPDPSTTCRSRGAVRIPAPRQRGSTLLLLRLRGRSRLRHAARRRARVVDPRSRRARLRRARAAGPAGPAGGRALRRRVRPRPASTAPPLRSFTLAASGDILLHTSVINMARQYAAGSGVPYDFAPMFAAVQPVIAAADLGICHLETPVAPPGEALSTYPIYGVPAEIVGGIKAAGFDRCSLASNHSMDRGTKGIDATLNALDAAGLGHTGMARSPEESLPSRVVVNGVWVAHLSYTFGFNGLSLPRAEAAPLQPHRAAAHHRRGPPGQGRRRRVRRAVAPLGLGRPQPHHARAAGPGRRAHPVGRHRPHHRPPRPRAAALSIR